jgi:hypothetical protein
MYENLKEGYVDFCTQQIIDVQTSKVNELAF